MNNKKKILFLCTGNSCRSQMAESWTRKLKGETFESYSAGTNPGTVDPRAIKVMKEEGVDLSGQKSKSIEDLPEKEFDYVVTVCDNARENCPYFPAKVKLIHFGFEDPPHLAKSAGSEEEALEIYRKVRDQIKNFVTNLNHILNV